MDVIKKWVRHKPELDPVIHDLDGPLVDWVRGIRFQAKPVTGGKPGYPVAGLMAAMPDAVGQEVCREPQDTEGDPAAWRS